MESLNIAGFSFPFVQKTIGEVLRQEKTPIKPAELSVKILVNLEAKAGSLNHRLKNLRECESSVLSICEKIKILFYKLFLCRDITGDTLSKKQKNVETQLNPIEQARSFISNPENRGLCHGLAVLELHKQLSNKLLAPQKRKIISNQIAEIFENEKDYLQMRSLREVLDSQGTETGTSLLHKLVYKNVEAEDGHKIIRAINERAAQAYRINPELINFTYQIYSDVDDTIKASLNDRPSYIKGFYPSSMQFFKELSQSTYPNTMPKVRFTILSARPDAGKKVWNRSMRKKLPSDLNFFALYGTTSSFKKGISYYTNGMFIQSLVKRLPDCWITHIFHTYVQNREYETYISFARDKRRNIDRDLLLRPEVRPLMVGDCGEGDLMFLLLKNCGAPSLFSDPRIPEEYETKWTDEYTKKMEATLEDEVWFAERKRLRKEGMEAPGNYPDKPLFTGFAHQFSTPSEFDVRPDPKNGTVFKSDLNVGIFRNYVDLTSRASKEGLIDAEAAGRIVQVARDWLADQKWIPKPEADVDLMSSRDRFRELLSRSISATTFSSIAAV